MWTKPLPQRRRRATTLIALAAILIAAAGAVYLRPTAASQPPKPASPPTIDPLMVASNPVTYDFVSPSMGWASLVFVGPSSQGAQFRIFRTTDGAKHWQQQLSGQNSFGFGFSPITVRFFGKTHGFMTVGVPVEQLYRTADGGASWEPLVLPVSRVDAITFSDAMSGWLVAYTNATAPGLQSHLYSTSDAGQSWQALPDPPVDAIYLAFRSPTEAWMGSNDVRFPHVYTTRDRGQSWQRHDLSRAVGAQPDDRYFQTSIQLLPVAGATVSVEVARCTRTDPGSPTICVNTTSESFLFASVDGGNSWRQIQSPPGTVAYQDSVHWWAMGANALFKSTDAGRSWKHVATIPPYLQFNEPHVLDSTHAWASLFVMGGYGLALSNDGGLHWTLARVPQPR